jgi:hypothetical protein
LRPGDLVEFRISETHLPKVPGLIVREIPNSSEIITNVRIFEVLFSGKVKTVYDFSLRPI